MSRRTIQLATAFVLFFVAGCLVSLWFGRKLALVLFLILWANNLEREATR